MPMTLRITDTTLRDAHQSLIATRMRLEDILPIAADMDPIGFFSLEAWGGATFDSCIRFLDEDPWERLRVLREHIPQTPLQMLLRGQNLVGYRHYADDVVEEFVRLAVKNGVGIFRIFDALNDIRNMGKAIRAAKEKKAHVQGTICYTVSPVHTIDNFVDLALGLEEAGCDSLCVKDMAGLLTPHNSFELIRALKKAVRLPLCSSQPLHQRGRPPELRGGHSGRRGHRGHSPGAFQRGNLPAPDRIDRRRFPRDRI